MKVKERESEVAQSCPTLCDPVDCSLPGSSLHGIFQARILEWVAISFSRKITRRNQKEIWELTHKITEMKKKKNLLKKFNSKTKKAEEVTNGLHR